MYVHDQCPFAQAFETVRPDLDVRRVRLFQVLRHRGEARRAENLKRLAASNNPWSQHEIRVPQGVIGVEVR